MGEGRGGGFHNGRGKSTGVMMVMVMKREKVYQKQQTARRAAGRGRGKWSSMYAGAYVKVPHHHATSTVCFVVGAAFYFPSFLHGSS